MKTPDPDQALAPRPRRGRGSGANRFLPGHSQRDNLVHLTVEVPEHSRRRIKTIAARDGVPVREVVLAGIRAELERRAKAGPAPMHI